MKKTLVDLFEASVKQFGSNTFLLEKTGKKFDACIALIKDEEGKVSLKFDFENVEAKVVKDVACPKCGGEMIVTPFGYACAKRDRNVEGSCDFAIGKIAEKDLNETQVRELINNGITSTIRGFKSKKGSKFDACLVLNKTEDGNVNIVFDFENVEAKRVKDVVCPVCGGEIVQTKFGFGCANYDRENEESCKFFVGKIAGVKIKEATLKELLQNKKTGIIEGFIAKTGLMFSAALKLDEEGKVVFDFPEKPKPVETTVKCPKCEKLLMRGQWQYECECGFKVFHTVAKVELSDEVMRDLLTTGVTKEKVTGFTSKAGNMFDAHLKFTEEEGIRFDFDRAEEPAQNQETANEDLKTLPAENVGGENLQQASEETT